MGWTDRTQKVSRGLAIALGVLMGLVTSAALIDSGQAPVALFLGPLTGWAMFLGLRMLLPVVLFPAVGLAVALERSIRRGVREARVATRRVGGSVARERALAALREAGLATELPADALRATPWTGTALLRRLRPLMLVGAAVAAVSLVGAVSYALLGGNGAGWSVLVLGPLLAAGAVLLVPAPDLGRRALGLAARAAGVEVARPPEAEQRQTVAEGLAGSRWHLLFPAGTLLRWVIAEGASPAQVELATGLDPIPFDAAAVAHDRLEEEGRDVDTGDATFDAATLVHRRGDAPGDAWATTWLTPPVRAVLLGLLAAGASVRGRGLVALVDLRDADALAELDGLIALIDGLGALLRRLDALTPFDRAVAALRGAGADAERRAILAEGDRLPDAGLADRVREIWAAEGVGLTRVNAALALRRADAQAARLSELVECVNEPAEVRAAALVAWARDSRRAAAKRVVAAVMAADVNLLMALALGGDAPGRGALLREVAGRLRKETLPGAAAAPVALLLGASRPEPWVPVDVVLGWIAQASAAPSPAAVTALQRLAGSSSGAIAEAAEAALRTLVAAQQGGLALVDTAAGGLSVAPGDPDEGATNANAARSP